jgi:hypothetical protein
MELPGDRLIRKLVSVCLQIVLILTLDRCTVFVERTQTQKSFSTHRMELLCDVGHVKSHFSPFGDDVGVGAS